TCLNNVLVVWTVSVKTAISTFMFLT
ncbi:helicase domain protein, partial [Vibrio parahaemolyticus V-223/04]